MKYLQKHGFKVIPVNPSNAGQDVLGELCYASLEEIPIKIDMVNIFRPSEFCPSITNEAIKIGVKSTPHSWTRSKIPNEYLMCLPGPWSCGNPAPFTKINTARPIPKSA